MPQNLAIGNYDDKIVQAGHPTEWDLCEKGDHIAWETTALFGENVASI